MKKPLIKSYCNLMFFLSYTEQVKQFTLCVAEYYIDNMFWILKHVRPLESLKIEQTWKTEGRVQKAQS